MSFMLTTQQVRDGTKTVTRRNGWWFLKPGDRVMACVKCQGLGRGGKIEKIREIEIVSVRRERLHRIIEGAGGYGRGEMIAEGFPNMTPADFLLMFCAHHVGATPDSFVNRIEFKYVTPAPLPEVKP
jgi:hypothetical protein